MALTDIQAFYRGDTKTYTFYLKDGQTGEPISVDGAKLTVTFKSDINMDDQDAEIQVSVTGVEPDPVNPTGKISLTLQSSDTTVQPGTYFYDFQFVTPAGDVSTVLPTDKGTGKVKIKQDVTRT